MPSPTEVNTDDITELKASNRRIVDALHTLELTMSQRFSQLEAKVDRVGDRVGTYVGIRKWAIGIATPIIVTLIGAAIAGGFYMGGLNARLDQLEPKADAPRR